MSIEETYRKFLDAYRIYYNVDETGESPFDATAVFKSSTEQYFLIRSAKIAQIDTNEYVYFAKREHLTASELKMLDQTAWERGCQNITPSSTHKSSDVILIVFAEDVDEEAKALIPKLRHSKTYKFGFWGFSNYKLAVIGSGEDRSLYNGQGRALKKLVADISKSN